MKKLLLSALILFSLHSNAAEITDAALKQRAEQLEQFYLREAVKNPPLQELKFVASSTMRKAFFEKLVAENNDINDSGALFQLIRSAACLIINSPSYYAGSTSFVQLEKLDPITWGYLAKAKETKVQ